MDQKDENLRENPINNDTITLDPKREISMMNLLFQFPNQRKLRYIVFWLAESARTGSKRSTEARTQISTNSLLIISAGCLTSLSKLRSGAIP
jgi:hypothetical protein